MALKVGTEDKKKVAIAAGLGVVVLVLAARTIFTSPDATVPPPATRSSVAASPAGLPAAAAGGAASTHKASPQIDPSLHPELMAENEAFVYNGSGRNIFSLNAPPPEKVVKIEPLKGSIRPSTPVPVVATGPPPPPAIDLRFFGFSARNDGSRKAFLLHGDDVFIASEGDVVSHRYRVVHIAPTSVQVEDLPYHNTQSLPLVQN